MGEFQHIRWEVDGGVGRLLLTRPPVNILNIAMMEEINRVLEDAAENHAIKVLTVQGEGKCFSAGVDVGEHTGELTARMIEVFHGMFHRLDALPMPTVALLHRSVLGGGCELAAACDMVLASDDVKIGQPEIQVGVFPPVAAALFPRMFGTKKAFELVLTGAVIGASEAKQVGLINHVYPADAFKEKAEAFLAGLAGLSGVVLRATKKALRAGLAGRPLDSLDTIEKIYLDELMKTHDANEGLSAFLQRRKPCWEDR
jgi:cyclohexa-1,5-dienecarbonyl-CoA hydratase